MPNPRATHGMIQVMAFFGTRPAEGGLARKDDRCFVERLPFRSDDHREEFGSLAVPRLLVHAHQSYALPSEVADRIGGSSATERWCGWSIGGIIWSRTRWRWQLQR